MLTLEAVLVTSLPADEREALGPDMIDFRRKCESDIWSVGDETDTIKRDVDTAVAQLEAICAPR